MHGIEVVFSLKLIFIWTDLLYIFNATLPPLIFKAQLNSMLTTSKASCKASRCIPPLALCHEPIFSLLSNVFVLFSLPPSWDRFCLIGWDKSLCCTILAVHGSYCAIQMEQVIFLVLIGKEQDFQPCFGLC